MNCEPPTVEGPKIKLQRVFIVDDDISVREAIEGLLETVDIGCEGFNSARSLLRRLHEIKQMEDAESSLPGCVILDVRMPGMSGLELQSQMLSLWISVPLIFVSGHADVSITVQAMKAGARDFLSKPFRDQELLDAVREALLYDSEHRKHEHLRRELHARYSTLTAREKKILQHVVDGLMNKQIADLMNYSEITIKVNRGALMQKMKARSIAELVRMEAYVNQNLDLPTMRISGRF